MCEITNSNFNAGTPSTGSPGSTPGTGTGTGTGTGATAGSPTVFGISPTSTISGNGDPSAAVVSYMKGINTILLLSFVCYLVFSLQGLN
ncbi:hypothetical protein A2U01_0023812 [Trifolium medium]|uniref:Uncharacterized protein n=1 Tax=Trifolium medium TaxID=97028 RepID=A0A392NSD3_9FABA|nr:hypothetical protein [Trifolium medium]